MDQSDIRWHILTHEHRDRSVDWYWGFGLAAVVGIIFSIYFSNILLAIIIAMGTFSVMFLTIRGPREHEVHLHKRGVSLDGTMYPYRTLHSFWVAVEESPLELEEEEFDPRALLYISTNSYIHPRIVVPLDDINHAGEVHEYLSNFMREEEHEPHLGDHLAELFGL